MYPFFYISKMTTLKITLENKHKYIDERGNLTVPEGIQIVVCSNNKLTCLIVPEGIQQLHCSDNKLTCLVVPNGMQQLHCSRNKLTSLIVPKGIQNLGCSDNKLTSLDVPEGIKKLVCSYNKLTSLIVPEGIKMLYCSHNELICINFKSPESLKYIDIENNENLVYPPKEYCSKSTKKIIKYCKENKIPQKLLLSERWEERWNIIKPMYIAHYKKSLDSESENFNMIPIEVITGTITRYVLT